MCCKVLFKISLIELWNQLTRRSITLLSSLVSWLTVALLSWGQKNPTNHHLWNIHQSNQFLHTHNWEQLSASVHKLIHFRLLLSGLSWWHLIPHAFVVAATQYYAGKGKKIKRREKRLTAEGTAGSNVTCRTSSEDSLGWELMACISTSCSKQPHTQVQKVRQPDSEIDGAVKACFSQEGRYCYKCVTDMFNPHRKQRGCCCTCTGCLPGPTQRASSANRCPFSCEIYTFA